MNISIVGAGMAGLLAGRMLQNTGHEITVSDAAKSLPNNHSAVLRFRTSQIGDILSVPFKKVKVAKSYAPWMNPVADSMAYSRKTNGVYRSDRSIITTGHELNDRFIAPPDLISKMASKLKINYGEIFKPWKGSDPIISTIPMPALMDALGWKNKPEFGFVHGYNLKAKIKHTDAYCSLYVPSPKFLFNRISVTGDELIVEYSFPRASREDVLASYGTWDNDVIAGELNKAFALLGIKEYYITEADRFIIGEPELKLQQYSKILPIDEEVRKEFLHWATDEFGIFSLGRYATWRPGLLLDDLVKDIRLIDQWISYPNKYAMKRHRAS